jgi:hypothetical protein
MRSFPWFYEEDANPDIGDSAITETGALGDLRLQRLRPLCSLWAEPPGCVEL